MRLGFLYILLITFSLIFLFGCGTIYKNLPPTPINKITRKIDATSNTISENFRKPVFNPIGAKYLYAMLTIVFLWHVSRTLEHVKKCLCIKYSDED